MANEKKFEKYVKSDADEEHFTAWVTSYVLTRGILKLEGRVNKVISPLMLRFTFDNHTAFAYGIDWHRTEAEAIARANVILADQLSRAKRKLELWEGFKFSPGNLKVSSAINP